MSDNTVVVEKGPSGNTDTNTNTSNTTSSAEKKIEIDIEAKTKDQGKTGPNKTSDSDEKFKSKTYDSGPATTTTNTTTTDTTTTDTTTTTTTAADEVPTKRSSEHDVSNNNNNAKVKKLDEVDENSQDKENTDEDDAKVSNKRSKSNNLNVDSRVEVADSNTSMMMEENNVKKTKCESSSTCSSTQVESTKPEPESKANSTDTSLEKKGKKAHDNDKFGSFKVSTSFDPSQSLFTMAASKLKPAGFGGGFGGDLSKGSSGSGSFIFQSQPMKNIFSDIMPAGDTATDNGDKESNDTETKVDLSVKSAPAIQKDYKIDHKTGEEDEKTVYNGRCKLFRLDASQWASMGECSIKVNTDPKSKAARIICRSKAVQKLKLNTNIFKDMSVSKPQPKSIQLSAWYKSEDDTGEGKITSFLIMSSSSKDSETLHQEIKDRIANAT